MKKSLKVASTLDKYNEKVIQIFEYYFLTSDNIWSRISYCKETKYCLNPVVPYFAHFGIK